MLHTSHVRSSEGTRSRPNRDELFLRKNYNYCTVTRLWRISSSRQTPRHPFLVEDQTCTRSRQPQQHQHQKQSPEELALKGITVLGIGLPVLARESRADFLETVQAGSDLVQKDTIIGIAFGTAILALGAVTIGVRPRRSLIATLCSYPISAL